MSTTAGSSSPGPRSAEYSSDCPASGLFDLTGCVAVVIGGAGVIGGEIADGFSAAGARLAILGRTPGKAAAKAARITAIGGDAIGIDLDATKIADLEMAEAAIARELGTADILVNAVGVNSVTPFFDLDTDEWTRIIDADLTSTFLACQVFGRSMVSSGRGGSIINLSSASSGPPLSRVFTYGVAKAAINNLTQYLARELAMDGIRVNAIVPGFFPGEQNRKILSPERIEAILRHTPMGRLGEPSELVGAAIWLASRHASGFVTGSLIRVDGGFSAMTI